MIDMLKQQHAALAAEKDLIQSELEQRAQVGESEAVRE